MAQSPAVHIELRDDAWIVIREGNQRATSVHPTQAEAAESGRELARAAGAQFFLHGTDGRVREHHDYSGDRTAQDEGFLDTPLGTVGTVTEAADGITSTAAQTLGADTTSDPAPAREKPAFGSPRTTGDTGDVIPPAVGSTITPEERYADYEVYDQYGQRIGPISDLFVDDNDEPEYVGVEPGTMKDRSVLVPGEVISINDGLRRMVVSRPITVVETAPSLGHDEQVTPDFERRVRLHYALPLANETVRPGQPGAPVAPAERSERAEAVQTGDPDPLSRVTGREDDEVTVQRVEEELLVGRREREAGSMRIRKRVRTETEHLEVPRKRVEVTVERVPVDETTASDTGITSTPQIEEEEIVVPIVEEEILIEKRPVVKEEIRIRKRVVEEVEIIEEDVRIEEVEIDDQTHRENDL
ncbi:MAG TPA: DUF2382 domain-containing protein [Rubrobacter sp.]|nr:DUF2382 domain-containing protein [Rubrobacter sp.]